MSKISLDWFLNKGFKLAIGDEYFDKNISVSIKVSQENTKNSRLKYKDANRFITEFAWRTASVEYKELPSGTPVEIQINGNIVKTIAGNVDWLISEMAKLKWRFDLIRLQTIYIKELKEPDNKLPAIGTVLEYVANPTELPESYTEEWETGDKLEVICYSKDFYNTPIAVVRHEHGLTVSLPKEYYRLPRTKEEIKEDTLIKEVATRIQQGGRLDTMAKNIIKLIKESQNA